MKMMGRSTVAGEAGSRGVEEEGIQCDQTGRLLRTRSGEVDMPNMTLLFFQVLGTLGGGEDGTANTGHNCFPSSSLTSTPPVRCPLPALSFQLADPPSGVRCANLISLEG